MANIRFAIVITIQNEYKILIVCNQLFIGKKWQKHLIN